MGAAPCAAEKEWLAVVTTVPQEPNGENEDMAERQGANANESVVKAVKRGREASRLAAEVAELESKIREEAGGDLTRYFSGQPTSAAQCAAGLKASFPGELQEGFRARRQQASFCTRRHARAAFMVSPLRGGTGSWCHDWVGSCCGAL